VQSNINEETKERKAIKVRSQHTKQKEPNRIRSPTINWKDKQPNNQP